MLFSISNNISLAKKTTQPVLTTSFANDRDFLDRVQASLETLLDGFPGVEPLGLPTGRFFFMILPGKMKNRS